MPDAPVRTTWQSGQSTHLHLSIATKMLRFSCVACLLALVANHTFAWTTKPSCGRQSQTALFAIENPSRRQWLSTTVTAASATFLPLPSFAAGKVKTSKAICDPTVSILKNKNRLIYVLGTAHISDVSAQLASQLVKDVQPDAVFIELDLKRVGGLPFNKIQRRKDRIEIPGPDKSVVIVPNIIPVSKTIELTQSQQKAAMASLMDAIDFGGPEEYNQALASLLAGAGPGAGISGMYRNLSKQGFKPGQE